MGTHLLYIQRLGLSNILILWHMRQIQAWLVTYLQNLRHIWLFSAGIRFKICLEPHKYHDCKICRRYYSPPEPDFVVLKQQAMQFTVDRYRFLTQPNTSCISLPENPFTMQKTNRALQCHKYIVTPCISVLKPTPWFGSIQYDVRHH